MGFFAVIMLLLLGLAGFFLMGRLDLAKKKKVIRHLERDIKGKG